MYIKFPHRQWSNSMVLLVVTIASFNLCGWLFDVESLKRIISSSVAMNPMTAIAFLLSAFSLYFLGPTNRTKLKELVGKIFAMLVLLIGLWVLLVYVFGFNFRIDQILFASKLKNEISGVPINRMAPNTAFCFILSGIGLLLLHVETRKKSLPSQHFALVIAMTAFLTVLGYLYSLQILSTLPFYIPMAIHTAACFLLLSLGILLIHPYKGMLANFTSTHTGGVVSRMFIGPAIVIPIVLGYLYDYSISQMLVAHSLATIFLVFSIIIGFIMITYFYAKSLNKNDGQRKKVELELKESNERFKSLFENAPDPMWLFDMETLRFLEVNQAAINQYGYSLKEFKDMGISEIRPIEEIPRIKEKIEKIRSDIKFGAAWKHKIRSGKLIDVEITYHLLENKGREECLVIAKDVTERIKSEAQIKELNKELEAFTFSVAHDLRAPLRIIDGYSRFLQEDYASALEGEGNRLLNIIANNAQQMGQLIDDLLNLSRVGRASLNCTHVDMHRLVEKCVEENLVFDTNNKAVINMHSLVPAYCDGVLMKSVFNNLVSNAIKYSQKNEAPQIDIGGYQKDGEIVYFVRDNGVGFDMKHANKLFGIFQRLHKVTEFKGTGVGLAIVQRIVSKHGGRVWANAIKGEGATFYFSLPYFVQQSS